MKWPIRWRKAKIDAAAVAEVHERREFIYLDEVSVTSLLSDRVGSIPKEFTESAGGSTTAEINAEVAAGVAPIKAKVGSRYESTRSVNTQVVSKAIIQTLFKQLFDLERDNFVLRSRLIDSDRSKPEILQRNMYTNETSKDIRPWVTPPADLHRGELLEVEIELETAGIFQLNSILSTFKEIADEYEDIRSQMGSEVLDKFTSISKVIEKMMVGLIPLKCRVVDYVVVETATATKIVHRSVLDELPDLDESSTQPLYLVGDAEQNLFWKDIRRVLFTNSRFRALCRLNNDGIINKWNPLKLSDTLIHVDPNLGIKLAEFGTFSVATLSGSARMVVQTDARKEGALHEYGSLLAQSLGFTLSDEDHAELDRLGRQQQSDFASAATVRSAFKPVQDFIEQRAEKSVNPETAAQLRATACSTNGLHVDGSPATTATTVSPVLASGEPENLLDVQVIAIYW